MNQKDKLIIDAAYDLERALAKTSIPVILVEGSRTVPKETETLIADMGLWLAQNYPSAIFRTGNASGSDTIFAQAIASVAPDRLEYVVPFASMGKKRRNSDARVIVLDDLPRPALERLAQATVKATTKADRLLQAYLGSIANKRLGAQGAYILRDTLKVLGAEEVGLPPATIGVFYSKDGDKLSGGTGHTVRVCQHAGVPAFLQSVWCLWPGNTP